MKTLFFVFAMIVSSVSYAQQGTVLFQGGDDSAMKSASVFTTVGGLTILHGTMNYGSLGNVSVSAELSPSSLKPEVVTGTGTVTAEYSFQYHTETCSLPIYIEAIVVNGELRMSYHAPIFPGLYTVSTFHRTYTENKSGEGWCQSFGFKWLNDYPLKQVSSSKQE